jgi:hypothetical protein
MVDQGGTAAVARQESGDELPAIPRRGSEHARRASSHAQRVDVHRGHLPGLPPALLDVNEVTYLMRRRTGPLGLNSQARPMSEPLPLACRGASVVGV